ncbi:MAG: ABC transporter permease [Dehalococcoidia bacterium]|nr:MAG: ABC transporter permease [Dehalococcoidia bacterium]
MAVAQQASTSLSVPQRRERTPWGDALNQLLKNKVAVGGAVFILSLALAAFLAYYLNSYYLQGYQEALDTSNQPAYAKQTLQDNSARPWQMSRNPQLQGFVYWLGADNVGRDIWSRTLYGAQVSMLVAVVAATVSLLIGLFYGMIAGYIGGRVDELMMRVVDFLYGLPVLILVILMQVFFKSLDRHQVEGASGQFLDMLLGINQSMGGLLFVFIALGAVNWLGMARIARGQTLSVKQKEFIEAARAIGVSTPGIIFKAILPNILGPCIVQETLQIPGYILFEAFLSFIGLGVNAPTPSWGIMINEAYQGLRSNPHALFPPSIALTLTVLAFNFLGDGLRDAFDPLLRE